jgi:hypothetical protein
MLGWFCYKYSDDYGQTWSEKRYRLPVRTTAVDRRNDWNGKVHILWGIGKPITTNAVACLAFTKMGKYPSYDSEGWIFRSDNILTEKDPDKIKWQMLPDGDHGLRNDKYGDVHAEQNLVPLDDGSLFCMYRTVSGYPMATYSRDGGHTWDKPKPATYTPNGKPFKHPRACPRIWKAENGKYLFWFHNHGGKDFEDRNPAWLSGGIEKDGFIHWSQPEIVLYMDDPYLRTSYPDLIEQNGKYWITETQKTEARVHEIDPTLLKGLWNQFDLKTMTTDGLVLDLPGSGHQMPRSSDMPDLPDFLTRGSKAENFSTKDLKAGFTLDMWLEFDDFKPGQIILDSRKENGQGLCLRMTDRQTLEMVMNDGRTGGHWDCDPGVLKPNTLHHVGIVVDGGPKIITFIIDGILNDGGEHRQFGWGRFSPNLRHTDGSDTLVIGSQIKSLLIYDRSLRTSEIVSNFQAGFKND